MTLELDDGTQKTIKSSQPRVIRRPLGPSVDVRETAVAEDAGSANWKDISQEAATSIRQLASEPRSQGDTATLQRARRQLWRDAAHGLERISLERLPRGGDPTLGVTSITVGQVLGLVSEGYGVERIMAEYHNLIDERDVREALIFALRLSS